MIVFLNEPKLSPHEVDRKFNEKRVSLIPCIKDFISNHSKFKDKETSVTFAHTGVQSLVCVIETSDGKSVLKIPLSTSYSPGEAEFLKIWEQAGAKVPHVIENGMMNGYPYILMEHIGAKLLKEVYKKGEMIKKEIYVELGKILSVMHSPKTKGYNRFVSGKAEFDNFEDWLSCEDIQKHVNYVKDNGLLSDEHGSLPSAFEILKEHVKKEPQSSYCHGDFAPANIFATNPFTIFDPSPRLNNGYIDLGRSIVINIANSGHAEIEEQLIRGYFNGEPFDRKALQAAILLNAYLKLPYQHKTNSLERMKNIQEYLISTKHLL